MDLSGDGRGFRYGDVKPKIKVSGVADGIRVPLASSLVQEYRDFRRSGPPVRFLCFDGSAWGDVPGEASNALRAAFAAGKAVTEAAVGGRLYVFDFLRMVRIDGSSGEASSIGWIDDGGQCFFPRAAPPCAKLEVEIRMAAAAAEGNMRKRKRGSEVSAVEERSDESNETMSSPPLAKKREASEPLMMPRWSKVEKLDEGDRFCKVVEKLFLAGMQRLAPEAAVTAVHKCVHGHGGRGSARLRAFQLQGQLAASTRGGESNVKFGWYGAPARDVAAAIDHGFGTTNSALLGARAHGAGVHLSPPQCPYPSAVLAEADESGEAHVVLCRVVMGRPEAVPAGSSQFHPSSDEYDSGVDDMANPRWYIVWSTHMNSHILPEYVVSFKFTNLQRQGSSGLSSMSKRSSAATTGMFPKLFAEIERCLPSSRVQTLERSYNSYKKGEINKEHFIRFLRMFVGDKLLATAAKKIRGY